MALLWKLASATFMREESSPRNQNVDATLILYYCVSVFDDFISSSPLTLIQRQSLSFFFNCVLVFCLHVCLFTMCAWYLWREARKGCQILWNCSYRQLWASVWVLGAKSCSSARTASILNHWTISSALVCLLNNPFFESSASAQLAYTDMTAPLFIIVFMHLAC